MKKKSFYLLVIVLLFIFTTADASTPDKGAFTPNITNAFGEGHGELYSWWTNTEENRALLTILLREDLIRQDYTAFNYVFPVSNLSVLLYHDGRKKDDSICAVYYGDAMISITYNAYTRTAFYNIDWDTGQINTSQIVSYTNKLNDGWYNSEQRMYIIDSNGFEDSSPAFSSAIQKWNEYLDKHPYLVFVPET